MKIKLAASTEKVKIVFVAQAASLRSGGSYGLNFKNSLE